jgi:hypothetical protein
MSIVVFIFLGLIADAGVMLYFGWGLIDAVIAGSLFSYIAVTGLSGLTIATLVALIAAAALHATHAMFRETRYRRRDPIRADQILAFPLSHLLGVIVWNESKLSPRSSPQ